ncbi:MAG TPA: nucleotidyltransferase family protein [Pyrinomonadaceae bacterium]|nr:nucleotidyltransferase family protein [Pyrinomonadaceae bacterium]
MAEVHVKSPGRLVAEMLRGSWRVSPPPLEFTPTQLKEITPLLQNSGAAALSWRRVQSSDLRDAPHARQLHQSYRRYTLRAALIQQTIKRAIACLNGIGVEPFLVKGWAAARLYPEQGLRPYGDIDLCVRPLQLAAAKGALKNLADEQHEVDLHCGFETLGGGDVDEIYARSQLAQLEETSVRLLSAEDHLRVLSIHMLREGAWRPLWLCDIAAAVEARPARFDWDQCLGKNRRQADWIICSIALAGQLLGADVSDTPAVQRTKQLPRWLIATVFKEWEAVKPSMTERHITPMARYLRYPTGILKGLRHRWPNPIEATVQVRGPFNELPRLPFQLGNCLARTAKFAARLPQSLRQR